MAGFTQALDVVFAHEGGFSDHPDDRGGATQWGVTQATYDDFRDSMDLPRRDVREITRDEARQLYHTRYWHAASCDAFPWPLSLCLFDAAVNHGVVNGVKLVQRALGVQDDGKVGPVTQGAAQGIDAVRRSEDMLWERALLYARIVQGNRSQATFLLGWTNRLRNLRSVVLGDSEPTTTTT